MGKETKSWKCVKDIYCLGKYYRYLKMDRGKLNVSMIVRETSDKQFKWILFSQAIAMHSIKLKAVKKEKRGGTNKNLQNVKHELKKQIYSNITIIIGD